MRLCRECYKRMLSVQMAIPIWQVEQFVLLLITGFGGKPRQSALKDFEFTRVHGECENCPRESRRSGHDPCIDMLIFDQDIGPFLPGKNGILRLFSAVVGFDAVTEDGNYVAMIETNVKNWLDEADISLSRFSDHESP